MCASMFDLKNLKDAFGTAFKERPHGLRKYIILLTIIFVLEILLQNGQHSTTFLFVRKGMWIVIVFAISNFYLIGFLCKSIRTSTTLIVHSVNWFHRFHEIFFRWARIFQFLFTELWLVRFTPFYLHHFLAESENLLLRLQKQWHFSKNYPGASRNSDSLWEYLVSLAFSPSTWPYLFLLKWLAFMTPPSVYWESLAARSIRWEMPIIVMHYVVIVDYYAYFSIFPFFY